jgi:hypothetical protein
MLLARLFCTQSVEFFPGVVSIAYILLAIWLRFLWPDDYRHDKEFHISHYQNF